MAPGSTHRYELTVAWTGNRGGGTSSFRSYSRDHEVLADPRPVIPGSSDPTFRGDGTRWDPERLLVASLSQCHMLWYLHLCAIGEVVVLAYQDHAEGTMLEHAGGGGQFSEVVLRPSVTVVEASMVGAAMALHERAHELCFIANSVNFEVRHEPAIEVG